jgi:Tol biopolymer transport system component
MTASTTNRPVLVIAVSAALMAACTAASSEDSTVHLLGAADPQVIRTTEGTALHFDLTPDGSAIVMDLLGQLWQLPVAGGEAIPLTSAVRDTADDRHPAISPDGAWIATRSDRPAGRGIWLHSRTGGAQRQLTDSAAILGGDVGVPTWSPDGRRLAYAAAGRIMLLNPSGGRPEPLLIQGQENGYFDEPHWSPDGSRLLVSGPWRGGGPRAPLESWPGASIWEVEVATGVALRRTPPDLAARAAAWSPDGRRIAWFTMEADRAVRLMVQEPGGTPTVVAAESGIEPRRVRWSPDGSLLYYVSRGRIWRVPAAGGATAEVPFTAELRLPSLRQPRPSLPLPGPGDSLSARGFTGLALHPAGERIAFLALGRLWVLNGAGEPRVIDAVHETASDLAWSPNGRFLVWSSASDGEADLWVRDLEAGTTRRLTDLPGNEVRPAWSNDGRWIAFLQWASIGVEDAPDGGGARLRVVEAPTGPVPAASGNLAPGSPVSPAVGSPVPLDLGPLPWGEVSAFSSGPQWTPDSDSLLIFGLHDWPVITRDCVEAVLVPLTGDRSSIDRFPCQPAHVHLLPDGSMLAVEEGRLVRRPRVRGGWGPVEWIGPGAALNPAPAANGDVLFVAPDGLRLHAASGADRHIGWPLRFQIPPARPLLLRNVRVVPLDGSPDAGPQDILLTNGRIRQIGPPASFDGRVPPGTTDLDGGGRWVIPGLVDVHVHLTGEGLAVPRAALYHGVTTVREMWHALPRAAALRDLQAAGEAAARVVVSGFPLYPFDTGRGLTSDLMWVPHDSASGARALSLLDGFGAGHVKMRYVQNWSAGAGFTALAAAAPGLPVGGHCAHAVALITAGMNTHEHADGQCGEWEFGVYEDIVELYRAGGVTVVPAIDLHRKQSRPTPSALGAHEVAPFLTRPLREWLLLPVDTAEAARAARREQRAMETTRRMADGGVRIALGSDDPFFVGAAHRELEALVRAGLSPLAALRAATVDAAAALGLEGEIGAIHPGFRGDLVVLEDDPRDDISDTRRIWAVFQDGRIVDRRRLLGR